MLDEFGNLDLSHKFQWLRVGTRAGAALVARFIAHLAHASH